MNLNKRLIIWCEEILNLTDYKNKCVIVTFAGMQTVKNVWKKLGTFTQIHKTNLWIIFHSFHPPETINLMKTDSEVKFVFYVIVNSILTKSCVIPLNK